MAIASYQQIFYQQVNRDYLYVRHAFSWSYLQKQTYKHFQFCSNMNNDKLQPHIQNLISKTTNETFSAKNSKKNIPAQKKSPSRFRFSIFLFICQSNVFIISMMFIIICGQEKAFHTNQTLDLSHLDAQHHSNSTIQ